MRLMLGTKGIPTRTDIHRSAQQQELRNKLLTFL
jgi:hypothetical protein